MNPPQVPTRRDQLSLKPKKKEKGRGRGGGRGGRGGCGQDKEFESYGYDDDEMWAEYWKWQGNDYWQDWHGSEAEVKPKKSKKRLNEANQVEDKESKKSKTLHAKGGKKRKEVGETFVPACGKKQIIADVIEFVEQFEHRTLDLDGMKVRIKEELPIMQNVSLNCYWTRAACGVRRKQGSKFVEVPNTYFRFTTCHASHNMQLAVSIGFALQLASHSS